MRRFRWVGLWALTSFTACTVGGTDDDPDASSTPAEQCQAVQEGYCERAISCYELAGITPPSQHVQNVQECLSLRPNCSTAVSVADSYSACLADLRVADCQEFVDLVNGVPGTDPMPRNCRDVIDFGS
ncbi:MAG TPA: hypothetical protein VKZ49_00640 [Polyangiaceae bacterium]|nr:hypothetical protein [Polyangiaceae bacterium]